MGLVVDLWYAQKYTLHRQGAGHHKSIIDCMMELRMATIGFVCVLKELNTKIKYCLWIS